MLHHKNMTVAALDKMDGWRAWTADVEDYTEETMPGIRTERRIKMKKWPKWIWIQRLGSVERWLGGF